MIAFPETQRERYVAVALTLLWRPYRWGGDDPGLGFDCSGFVQECLASIGAHPQPGVDLSAHALYALRRGAGMIVPPEQVRPGCEVYWLSNGTATHVEIILAVDPVLTIGAEGGGSTTTTTEAAWAQNAYIRPRPLARRETRALVLADPWPPE